MSWVFARMLILVFPVMLFFMGVTPAGFSEKEQLSRVGTDPALALGADKLKELAQDATEVEAKYDANGQKYRILKTKTGLKLRESLLPNGETHLAVMSGEGIVGMKFSDLNDAAYDPAKRESLQGQTVILEGRVKRLADKEFSLFRMKMTCCKADEVPLKVRIIVPSSLNNCNDFDWVKVKGQIQFLKAPGKDRYVPVLMVADNNDVVHGTAPAYETE
jgi:hypothetical protein